MRRWTRDWGRGRGQPEEGREAQGSDLPKPTVSLKSPRWRLLPWSLLISAGQALTAAYSQILALVERKIRVRATHDLLRGRKDSSGSSTCSCDGVPIHFIPWGRRPGSSVWSENPAGSTYSSTTGLSPLKHGRNSSWNKDCREKYQ